MSGTNSRVNIKSHDASSNISLHGTVYDVIRQALTEHVSDAGKLTELQNILKDIENATDQPGFLRSYQNFTSATGDYISALAPFLPALMDAFKGLS